MCGGLRNPSCLSTAGTAWRPDKPEEVEWKHENGGPVAEDILAGQRGGGERRLPDHLMARLRGQGLFAIHASRIRRVGLALQTLCA